MRVAVIGAGLGGLSTAAHLVGRGHEVVVLERQDVRGGRAGLWETGGYRFDTGPTLLTMTGLLEETFTAAGAAMSEYVTLKAVDPMFRACFVDGSELHVRSGREAMAEEISNVFGAEDAANFHRFCDTLGRLHDVEPTRSPLAAIALARAGVLGAFNHAAADSFADERLQQLFSFPSLYGGLSP